ncbi:peptidoglycan-binding protein [Streptomyces sp. AHU1]|uniref:peptidoglycan-binding domain-containing protein n=1 Tax=Streptomyces sp. AHU1 TaxID=3377215 RepID=UPI0038778F4A
MKSALRAGAATCAAFVVTAMGTSSASAQPGVGNVQYGSRGAGVTCVQIAVNAFYSSRLEPMFAIAVDGVFGKDTRRGVMDFQRALGDRYYAVDGIVGPRTGTELWADYLAATDPYCYKVIPTLK